jgi:signal transduction histidine kinase
MTSEKRSGRKKLLVNRPYQMRFVLEILAVVVLATFISAVAIYVVTDREIESGFYTVHRNLQDIRQLLMPVLAASAVVTFIVMSLLGAYITLRETHKVIGPARKMERKFLEMSSGDFSLMDSFRKEDVLKGLDDFINVHLNTMADYFTILDGSLKDVRELIGEMEAAGVAAEETASRLRSRIDAIEKSAHAFRQV